MAVGAHALHSVYMQGVSFLRARQMLMHDLGKSSTGDAERFWRTDPKPESLNMRPESPREVAGQEASDNLPFEYNRSAAALSGVESGESIHPRYLVPPLFALGLGASCSKRRLPE